MCFTYYLYGAWGVDGHSSVWLDLESADGIFFCPDLLLDLLARTKAFSSSGFASAPPHATLLQPPHKYKMSLGCGGIMKMCGRVVAARRGDDRILQCQMAYTYCVGAVDQS